MVRCKNILSIVSVIVHIQKGIFVNSLKNSAEGPVVHTQVGVIRGLWAEDGNYSMFLGIPYANVNKSNPFGDAIPNPKLDDIFDASKDLVKCPQQAPSLLDCLNLNIYVPRSANAHKKLPVLVWIYGGRFSIGYAHRKMYGPKYLVQQDIILIVFNYRVGPYGFMCLDIPEVPGNQGLKDQVIALRWIKDNIAAFGGDDTRITISGNSSGASCVDLHVYYNQEGFFHRIIIQSGNALKSNFIMQPDYAASLKLAEYLGYSTSDASDAISFLTKINSDQVINATAALELTFRPCVEKSFPNVTRYITEHPVNVDKLRVRDIDIMIGFNNDESYVKFAMMQNKTKEETDFVAASLRSYFEFEDNYEYFTEMKRIVTQFYVQEENTTGENQNIVDMDSDFHAYHTTMRSVKKYVENGVDRLFFYLFSYCGGRNFHKRAFNLTGGKAAHADEIGYLFGVFFLEDVVKNDDQIFMDVMTTLWANFVKYGNPTPSTNKQIPLLWPRVTPDKMLYLELDSKLRVGINPFHHRMAFHDLFYKLNQRYLRGNSRGKDINNEEEKTNGDRSYARTLESQTSMESSKNKTMRSEL